MYDGYTDVFLISLLNLMLKYVKYAKYPYGINCCGHRDKHYYNGSIRDRFQSMHFQSFHPLVYIYEHTDEPETNETSVITIVIVFYCATE